MASRPLPVTLVAILTLLNGVVTALAGVLAIVLNDDMSLEREVGATSPDLVSTGVFLLVGGVAIAVIAVGLAQGGRRWRTAVLAMLTVSTVGNLFALAHSTGQPRVLSGLAAIVSTSAISLLMTRRAKDWFGVS